MRHAQGRILNVMVHVIVNARSIVICAAHRAGDPPPVELAATVSAIASALDSAGVSYTAREASASLSEAPAPFTRHHESALRKPKRSAARSSFRQSK